jgi:hypothetical protein
VGAGLPLLLAIREALEWLVRHVIVEPMPERLSRARQSTDPTHCPTANTLARSGGRFSRSAGGRPHLVGESAAKPRKLQAGEQATDDYRARPRGVAGRSIHPAATAGTDTAKALAPDVIRGSAWRGRPRSGDRAAACGFSMRIILRFRCQLRADYACDFRCELRADYTAVSMQTSGRLKVAISSSRRFPTGGSELFQPAVSGPQFRPVSASSSRGFRRRFGASSGGSFRPTIFGVRLVGAMGPPRRRRRSLRRIDWRTEPRSSSVRGGRCRLTGYCVSVPDTPLAQKQGGIL